MRAALALHDRLVEAIAGQHGGVLVRPRGEGDSRFAVFFSSTAAVVAATSLQRAMHRESWSLPHSLRVRMTVHTGEADLRENDFYGAAPNRCARIRSLAYPDQILLSATTAALVRDELPEDISLRDLGLHRLKDLTSPEHIFQVVHPELLAEFPPLRSFETVATNLPVQLPSFVGRDPELAEVNWQKWRHEGWPYLNAEFDNLRAVLGRCREGSVDQGGELEMGLRLWTSVWWYWSMHGRIAEVADWFTALLAKIPWRVSRARFYSTWLMGVFAGVALARFDLSSELLREAHALAKQSNDKQAVALVDGAPARTFCGRANSPKPRTSTIADWPSPGGLAHIAICLSSCTTPVGQHRAKAVGIRRANCWTRR